MTRRKPLKKLQPIGDILHNALRKRGLKSGLEDMALFKLWPQAVGAAVAQQTRPDALRGGTLFVKTTSSIWVQQLHFLKDDIRTKLNTLSKKNTVKDIIFTVGAPAVGRSFTQKSKVFELKLKERDKQMIADSTAHLADRELAAILKRVMEKEISRRRRMEDRINR